MALKYKVKTKKVMDGSDEIATVRGLSFNDIVALINVNREAMEALFNKFQGKDPANISEDEVSAVGMDMIEQAPVLAAQIIASATDAWQDYVEGDSNTSPLEVIMDMPAGLQLAFLQEIGELTFSAGGGAKKMLALAIKAVRGGSQSAG